MENPNIHVLIFHNVASSPKFQAIACWTHRPTVKDIMKLDNFSLNTKLDQDLANLIVNETKGGLRFSDESEDFCEYMIVSPEENGDLNLNEYLYTGVCEERQLLREKIDN